MEADRFCNEHLGKTQQDVKDLVGKTPHASVFSDSPLRMSIRLGRHSCYLQFSGDGKVIGGSTMARY